MTILLTLSSIGANLHAECPVGVYVVSDQANLDRFPDLYPECEELDALSVRSASATNLSPLGVIKKINGDATFMESFHLLGLSGMSELREIGGSLIIDDMDSLVDLSGLEGLERIGGDLIIEANSQMTDLDGLFALKEIGGKLYITNNSVLTTLFNTPSLQFLGLTPKSDLFINTNPVLNDLNGLQSIKEIKGKLLIQSNKVLKHLDGLSGVGLVDSAIDITGNESLENADGLKNIEFCNWTINISSNKNLQRIDFQKLKGFKKSFSIMANPELRRLDGINSLPAFDGQIVVKNNVKLDSVRAFNGLIEAGSLLVFSNNGPFSDFKFLGNLKRVAGSFQSGFHPASFIGLENLTYVGMDLTLSNHAKSLAGFENLRYVGQKLHISGDSLNSITALANLDTVRELSISSCYKLTSLSGLDNIDAGALGQVVINTNPVLGHCAVKSMCDFLEGPGKFVVVTNAGNCINEAAIKKSCDDPIKIAPPASGKTGPRILVRFNRGGIDIHLALARPSLVGLRVYDTMGNLVADRSIGIIPVGENKIAIPIHDFKRGVYLVEARLDSERSMQKALFNR